MAERPRHIQEGLVEGDPLDQPGAIVDLDRSEVELELVVAWSEYEQVRSGIAS